MLHRNYSKNHRHRERQRGDPVALLNLWTTYGLPRRYAPRNDEVLALPQPPQKTTVIASVSVAIQ